MVYCQSQIPVVLESRDKPFHADRPSISPVIVDPEMATTSPSARASISPPRISSFNSLPFSQPKPNSPLAISTFPSPASSHAFHPVVLQPGTNAQSPHRHVSLAPSFAGSMNSTFQTDSATCKSGRLSKPLPPWCI